MIELINLPTYLLKSLFITEKIYTFLFHPQCTIYCCANDNTNCRPCYISYLRSIAETGIKPGRSDNIQRRRTTITESWPSGQTHLNDEIKLKRKNYWVFTVVKINLNKIRNLSCALRFLFPNDVIAKDVKIVPTAPITDARH